MSKVIPLLNLKKLHALNKKEYLKIFNEILDKNDFILGNSVNKFEKEFSNYVSSKYSIGVSNGTDALTLALKALNLPKNSKILVPAMTYISTAFAVINAGYKLELIDVDECGLINLNEKDEKIYKKVKAILPVSLYGQVPNLSKLKNIKKKFNLKIVLDASQAQGSYACGNNCPKDISHCCKKNKPDSFSFIDIVCYSLYPGKNLGAFGDAGVVTTNNKNYYTKICHLRNLGFIQKNNHKYIGFNNRLDTLNAEVLRLKLAKLEELNDKRRSIYKFYSDICLKKNINFIEHSLGSSLHQFLVLPKNKKKFIRDLNDHHISYGFHYSKPIHKHNAFKNLPFYSNSYPFAEFIAKNSVSIPIDPMLNYNEIKLIISFLSNYDQ